MSHHPVFYELSKDNSPSILVLIAAQVKIYNSLERTWFEEYVSHLKVKEVEETDKEEERKSASRASTVRLNNT